MPAAFRRILVAVREPGRTPRAMLRKTAALARAAGAQLELFHAVNEPLAAEAIRRGRRGGAAEDAAAATAQRLEKRLQRLASLPELQGLRVSARAHWDYPPHEAIVRRALATRAGLVVAQAQPPGRGARLLLANTDWELIRNCPCPLLLTKTGGSYDNPAVLAAVDPFHQHDKPASLDARLLESAATVAELLGGELHVFHAYLPMVMAVPAPLLSPGWVPPEQEQVHAELVRTAFDRLAEHNGIPRSRRHLAIGDVPTQLSRTVRRIGARIVVMGAVSRSGLTRIFIGSTAERVLDELRSDVLVVKPRGFRTAIPPEVPGLFGPAV